MAKTNSEVFTEEVSARWNLQNWQKQLLLEILEKPKRNTRLIKAGKRRGQIFGANPSYVILDEL